LRLPVKHKKKVRGGIEPLRLEAGLFTVRVSKTASFRSYMMLKTVTLSPF